MGQRPLTVAEGPQGKEQVFIAAVPRHHLVGVDAVIPGGGLAQGGAGRVGIQLQPAGLGLNGLHHRRQLIRELLSQIYEHRAIANQLFIPHIQRIHVLGTGSQIFQQQIPLIQRLVIIYQVVYIDFIQLTQFQINKFSSSRWTLFDDLQILRRKKHHIGNTKKLAGPPYGNSIDGNALGLIFLEMHIDSIGGILSVQKHLDMGLLRLKPDHLPIAAASVGFVGAAQIHCFQNVGLSLGIVTVKDIDTLMKFQFQLFIISEILQFN